MFDSMGMADVAIGQAMQGSIAAFAVLLILVSGGLVALLIWRRTAVKPSEARAAADCQPTACVDIARVLSELRHLDQRLQEAGTDRRCFQDRVEENVVRLHDRIDKQGERFVSQEQLDDVRERFLHFSEEVNRLLELLNDRGR